jgi:hypothetical protein
MYKNIQELNYSFDGEFLYNSSKNKVASVQTKSLEGLPILVIEDELDDHEIFMIKAGVSRDDIINWKKGYSRAKETYKFTEEDFRGFGLWLDEWWRRGKGGWRHVGDFYKQSKPVKTQDLMPLYLKEISLKELWVEVEEKHFRTVKNSKGELIDHEFILEPKITNNTIHAVWK